MEGSDREHRNSLKDDRPDGSRSEKKIKFFFQHRFLCPQREFGDKPGIWEHLLIEPDRLELYFMTLAHVFVDQRGIRRNCLENFR